MNIKIPVTISFCGWDFFCYEELMASLLFVLSVNKLWKLLEKFRMEQFLIYAFQSMQK
nr:MAG TPA: hypothetical protein [Caudoviricetes sp.]